MISALLPHVPEPLGDRGCTKSEDMPRRVPSSETLSRTRSRSTISTKRSPEKLARSPEPGEPASAWASTSRPSPAYPATFHPHRRRTSRLEMHVERPKRGRGLRRRVPFLVAPASAAKICNGVGFPGKCRLSATGIRANPNRKRRARMSGRAFWNCHSGREPRSSEPSTRARPRRLSPGREPRIAARLGDAPEEGATCGPHPGPLRSDPRNRPGRRPRAGPRR